MAEQNLQPVPGDKPEVVEINPQAIARPELRPELVDTLNSPDAIRELFISGVYPYASKMGRGEYEDRKRLLQVELLKVQRWVKETGQKIVILFEGRDAAGKGGTIKRFMEHLNPRGARVVALEKPTDLEKGSGTSSVMSITSLPMAKSCCSTAVGTTGQA